MIKLTHRREFLKTSLAASAAAGSAVIASAFPSNDEAPAEPKTFLEPFDYEGVTLSNCRLKKQFDTARDYFHAIPNDDILKGFRTRAGLPAPGKDLGGWYSGDPSAIAWWSSGDIFHVFGQWLSGMARMSRATNDTALRDKATYLVVEWAKTIRPDGFFFYSNKPNAPHYIYEKTVCGLVDMYQYAGCKDALSWLEKITDWAIPNLDRSRKVNSGMEWYTLSENLYRAYLLTGNVKYKSFGDVWRFTDYWKTFTSGSSLKSYGHHAYSHVNTHSSAAMTYAVTGDQEYLKTIVNAYDWLERTQFYATGGYGPDETLLAADGSLGKSLETTTATFETPCGSWAAFKLSLYLLRFTGDPRYGDWIEKHAYNGIGAALPMGPNGQTFYYSDYRMGGGRKKYYSETWPCCSGTITQAISSYYNLAYFKGRKSLYINLFVPSTVSWNCDGTEVRLEQETDYPEADSTTVTVRPSRPKAFDLKFRVPRWSRGASASVNGEETKIECQPGTWAMITRTWKSGDRVSIRIPMELTLAPIDKEHPKRVALVHGPVVLVQDRTALLKAREGSLTDWIVPTGRPLEFTAQGQRHGTFVPFYTPDLGSSYNMYFDLES